MNLDNFKQYLPAKVKTELLNNAVLFEVEKDKIAEIAIALHDEQSLPLKFITATDERRDGGCFKVWYFFSTPEGSKFIIPFIKVKEGDNFPSLSNSIPEALIHERKIMTFFGLVPVGLTDQRPIILQENWPTNLFPLRKDFDWKNRPEEANGDYPFVEIKKEGIYEIPVGPIHAGIIEPGHFRFSVLGEEIVNLEARLGFVHKGSEKLFEVLPTIKEKIRLSEKISGDSSFSHSLAFCNALEQLSDIVAPKRAEYLRVIFAELERLANHFGDIGAMMLDTGFNFGGAQGSRLREMILQINERLTGSRFLRGVNTLGGVTKDINPEIGKKIIIDLSKIEKDFSEVIKIAEGSASLENRLKTTGRLSLEAALENGATGVPARAVGISMDVRFDAPYAAYGELNFGEPMVEKSGDAYARFMVRVKEVFVSIKLITEALNKIPEGTISAENNGVLKKNSIAISTVEGWRGEIIYFVTTDEKGDIQRVALRDPSFVNWSLLGCAGPGNIVPDFPLINKSFNLSYTGNDL